MSASTPGSRHRNSKSLTGRGALVLTSSLEPPRLSLRLDYLVIRAPPTEKVNVDGGVHLLVSRLEGTCKSRREAEIGRGRLGGCSQGCRAAQPGNLPCPHVEHE